MRLCVRSFPALAALALGLSACTATGMRVADLPKHNVAAAPLAATPTRSDYDGMIARYAAENGVPFTLARAVVEQESGYNPHARGGGAMGLMQIKPATARGIGYDGPAEGLYDPETNLRWGMRYLGRAYALGHGDVCGTALRYQGGHRATRQTASTRRYCAELKARMADSRT